MKQQRLKNRRRARLSAAPSAESLQMRQRGQALKQCPRRFANTLEQSHRQYRMLVLLAPLVVSMLDWSMAQALLPVASGICITTRHMAQWPRRFATALQQPHAQYRVMFLLTVLLTLLIGWSAFFPGVLHLTLAIAAGRV